MSTKQCPYCGSRIALNAVICPVCNQPVMGAPNNSFQGGGYIPNQPSNYAPPPPPVQQTYSAPVSSGQFSGINFFNEPKARVNKVTYLIINFLLGWIGIHKFLTGKPIMGILYLLLSWTFIPGICSLIDLFAAIQLRANANGDIYV